MSNIEETLLPKQRELMSNEIGELLAKLKENNVLILKRMFQ